MFLCPGPAGLFTSFSAITTLTPAILSCCSCYCEQPSLSPPHTHIILASLVSCTFNHPGDERWSIVGIIAGALQTTPFRQGFMWKQKQTWGQEDFWLMGDCVQTFDWYCVYIVYHIFTKTTSHIWEMGMLWVWNWPATGVLLLPVLHWTEWVTVRQSYGLNQNWEKLQKQGLSRPADFTQAQRKKKK